MRGLPFVDIVAVVHDEDHVTARPTTDPYPPVHRIAPALAKATTAKQFGKAMHESAAATGLSRSRLANRTSRSYSYVCAVMDGTLPPSFKFIEEWLRALGIDPRDELWDDWIRAWHRVFRSELPEPRIQPERVISPSRALNLVEAAWLIAQWVALATSAGVLGNIAYDHIKSRLPWVGARQDTAEARRGIGELRLIAMLAVQARCGEIELPVPRLEDLRNKYYHQDNNGWLVEVHDRSNSLYGIVHIPHGELDGTRLEVRLKIST